MKEKRLALITGATRGLGMAIATTMKAKGYTVIANHHKHDDEDENLERETGFRIYGWDVSDFAACQEWVTKIEAEHGPIDVLVNNAGITRDATLHKMTLENWTQVIAINLGSVFNMCRQVIPGMRERGFGRIINISSVNGQKGQFGQANYAAAKAGILGFTKSIALENARKGITANAIAPGYCDTDMMAGIPEKVLRGIVEQIPVGRLGDPGEIARAVAFLASDEAAFVTGSTLAVNGGQYMA